MKASALAVALAVCLGPVALRAESTTLATPAAPIEGLNKALQTSLKSTGTPFAKRFDALAPAVDHAFNLQQVLKTIVGLRWSSIPPADQQKLLSVFRAYTVANYAANFTDDAQTSIKLLPETRDVGADRVVETEIVPATGEPTRVDYVMRQFPDGWQAIDVLEEGTISQAAVQRSDFRSLLTDGAGKLIASLQAKVQTLSGGTVKP